MGQSNTYTKKRRSMTNLLVSGLKAISDSGNPITSKIIMYFGVGAGVGGGTVQTIAKNTSNEFMQQCAEMTPDWLAYVPAVGVSSLVIKNIADWHFRRIEVNLKIKESEKNDV